MSEFPSSNINKPMCSDHGISIPQNNLTAVLFFKEVFKIDSYTPKVRLVCLLEILKTYTDESNILSPEEICDKMSEYGYAISKRTLLSDLKALKQISYEIVCVKNKQKKGYYLARDFSDASIQMILDAVHFCNLFRQKDIDNINDFLRRNVSIPVIERITETTLNITPKEEPVAFPAQTLIDIRTAICENKKANVTYSLIKPRAHYTKNAETAVVTVNFKKIVICRNKKYALFVRDESPEKYEYIPLKRIKQIELIDLPSFDPPELQAPDKIDCFFNFLNGERTCMLPCVSSCVEIKLHKDHIETLDNSIDSVIQYKKANEKDYCIAKFNAVIDDKLIGFLILHSNDLTLISLESLKEEITEKLISINSKR